jgi:hypothetical protein
LLDTLQSGEHMYRDNLLHRHISCRSAKLRFEDLVNLTVFPGFPPTPAVVQFHLLRLCPSDFVVSQTDILVT